MAERKGTEDPDKAIQPVPTKAKLPTAKEKPNNSTNVKSKVSKKSAQKPGFVDQNTKERATLTATAQNPKLQKKTSPFISGKEEGTSHAAVRRKETPFTRSTAIRAPNVAFGELEQLGLRQSIGLLFVLNKTPQEASPNEIPTFLNQEDHQPIGRALTLSQEKELAGVFAFLAAISDDPHRVAALCLEESLDHTSLSIKIAANHGDLRQTKDGLDKIARILKNCHEGESSLSLCPRITSDFHFRC
jgi:hypothetical protein